MSRNRSEARSSRFLWTLVGICCVVFVIAIARQILPAAPSSGEKESLVELRERLAKERAELRVNLQHELEDWQNKNRELEQEIESLRKVREP